MMPTGSDPLESSDCFCPARTVSVRAFCLDSPSLPLPLRSGRHKFSRAAFRFEKFLRNELGQSKCAAGALRGGTWAEGDYGLGWPTRVGAWTGVVPTTSYNSEA